MRKSLKISGLFGALLFVVGAAEAAGLGKLSVQSALGQPLKAEIELLSVNKDELPAVTARLAGADAFRQARIERSEALATLRFSVEQRANGQPVIRVSSSAPIADPFLDLLIEVNWNSGRLLREYTVLLDPPAEAKAAPIRVVAPPEAARSAQPQSAEVLAPVPERKAVTETARPKMPEPVSAKQPKRYGPVKSGETLRGIAGKVKPDSLTLEQMLVGLYQANRNAFYAGNMNRLKRGQVLNVPTAESVHLQASPAQAARTVQGHAADWHAYRQKVAEMAGEAPAAKAPEPATGKLAPKAEEKAPPAAAAPKDVLKLSKGEPGAAGRPDAKTQARLQALDEELAAKGRALQEAQDRVGQLERTVRDMQKLLELKTQEAAKAPPAAAAGQPPKARAPAPVAPAPPLVKPKPAPVVMPAPVQQPSSSWISTFISNPIYVGGIVAAVLLSVLLWMMMVGSRRRQGLNKFEDSIMTGGEFKNNAVFSATSSTTNAAGTTTEGSMLLTDFSRLGLGAIDTHEVDPIAEAEVYMAYGRDAQAEEILKEALNKDPSRHEIALKLLEIYAARKDTLAFETVASELYAGMAGQATPVWQRAAEMGRSIDPSNPLYRATASEMPSVSAFAAKPNGRSVAPAAAAAPADDFPQGAGQKDDWAAPAPGRDADFDIPAVAAAATSTLFAPRDEARVQEPLVAQSPKQEVFTASLPGDDFALEFEPATSALPAAAEATPFAEDRGWDVPSAATLEPVMEAEVEVEAEAPLETYTAAEAPAWQELPADRKFEATPVFEEALEPVEALESVPVLDFSGIDLELEAEPAASTETESVVEMPAPVEAEPVIEVFAPTEDFAPDMIEEFTPAPVAEPVEPIAGVQPAAATPPAEVADSELWEEANTKLDLARAYLEMGDKEGAREILQEVLGEGDSQQKANADKLLAEVG